jgi:hypothetical protein
MDVQSRLSQLVDAWCERRCLSALRHILAGWPLASGLTDEWADLLDSLKNVRAFASDELTDDEQTSVDELVRAIEAVVYR